MLDNNTCILYYLFMTTTKFQFTKFGLKNDPRGAHVMLAHQGQRLLGEVVDATYDAVCGCVRLTVRHFNGGAWPVQPSARAVDVLVRS